jgi:hypothetical protein
LNSAFGGRLAAQDSNDEPASSLIERIKRESLVAPGPSSSHRGGTAASRGSIGR